jgi:hypothetical protein
LRCVGVVKLPALDDVEETMDDRRGVGNVFLVRPASARSHDVIMRQWTLAGA